MSVDNTVLNRKKSWYIFYMFLTAIGVNIFSYSMFTHYMYAFQQNYIVCHSMASLSLILFYLLIFEERLKKLYLKIIISFLLGYLSTIIAYFLPALYVKESYEAIIGSIRITFESNELLAILLIIIFYFSWLSSVVVAIIAHFLFKQFKTVPVPGKEQVPELPTQAAE